MSTQEGAGIHIPVTADTSSLSIAKGQTQALMSAMAKATGDVTVSTAKLTAAEGALSTSIKATSISASQASGAIKTMSAAAMTSTAAVKGASENIMKAAAASNAMTSALGDQVGVVGKVVQSAGALGMAFAAGGPVLLAATALATVVGSVVSSMAAEAKAASDILDKAIAKSTTYAARIATLRLRDDAARAGVSVDRLQAGQSVDAARTSAAGAIQRSGSGISKGLIDDMAKDPGRYAGEIERAGEEVRDALIGLRGSLDAAATVALDEQEANVATFKARSLEILKADDDKAAAAKVSAAAAHQESLRRKASNVALFTSLTDQDQALRDANASLARERELDERAEQAAADRYSADERAAGRAAVIADMLAAAAAATVTAAAAFEASASAARSTADNVLSSVGGQGGIAAEASGLLGGLGAAIGTGLAGPVGAGIGGAVGSLLGGLLGDGLDKILASLDILAPLVDGIAVLFEGLSPLLLVVKDVFGSLGAQLGALAPIVYVVAEFLGQLIAPLNSFWSILTPLIGTLATLVATTLKVVLLFTSIPFVMSALVNGLTFVANAVESFANGVNEAVAWIYAGVTGFYNSIVTWINETTGLIVGDTVATTLDGSRPVGVVSPDDAWGTSMDANTGAVEANTAAWEATLDRIPSGFKVEDAIFRSATGATSSSTSTTNNYSMGRRQLNSSVLDDLRRTGLQREAGNGRRAFRDERN